MLRHEYAINNGDGNSAYELQQLRDRLARRCPNADPMSQPIPTQLYCLRGLSRRDAGVVDTEQLDRLRVSPLALVDSNDVIYAVVPHAVYGQS